MKAIEKISQELFDNLKAPYIKNLSMGDADANSTDDAEQARNFAFNFSVGNFTLGTVQVKLNSDKQYLEVQFGHDLLNKVEDQSPEVQQRIKQLWFGFLRKMRKFVNTCPELTFKINNETQDHLNKKDAEMYTVDELKEGKMSKLAGSTKSSYQRVGENRIIIRHVGPIDEEKMGSRTRNIKAIYIENAAGERFLVKENSLIGARILAHHMSAGGNLMDDFSNHLYTMIREMRDLKSFVLASRNKVFESDDANQMVEAATEYYRALRETVRSLTTGRGYARYLESFDPKIDETNIDAEALKEKFVIRTFNEKFEAALPHIAKAYQKKIQEQNALYGAAQNYIDGETKFGLTESDVELYKSMKFESGQALSKKVLEHIATLLQGTDSRLSEFAAQSAEKFSTITEAPESQTWLHQDLAMNLVKGFVAEMNNLSEKALNPYAIGMAQAMKSTGDEPPLKKSTIKKAHHIADKIADKEQGMAEGLGKSIKRGLQGWGSPQDTPANIVKRNKAYDIDTAKGLRAGMDDAAADHSPQGLQKRVLDRKLKGVAEGVEYSPVTQAITRRILRQRTDLLAKYGPEKVGNAIDEVADFVGDVEEIGSSDVSGWVRHVEQMLGNMQGVAEGSDAAKYYIVNHDTNENIDGPFDTREEAETVYDSMIKRVESGTMEKNFKIQKKKGVAEGYQLDEGAIETITALVKKIPGIGKYYQMAQQYKPQLIEILKTSKSGKEVKQKMEQLAAGQSATVAESGMLKQLGGLAVGGGSILSTMWMNAMGMIDGVLAHAAAGEVGGAVASGSILGLIPVTLMLFAAMLLFKGSNQSSDEKAQAFQAQRSQQGVAEGSSDNNAVIYDNGYVKIDGKMYKAKRMNHESGLGIVIQTPTKMYFSPIENEYEMPSVTIHRALKMGGLNPVFNEGVAEEVMVEISSDTLKSYQQKVSNDAMKHKMDPTKRSPEKANRSISGFSKAQKRLEKGVAEGFEPGHREIERWATQSEENQKIYNAYIKAGKMADEAYKQNDGASYTGLQLRQKQIRDLIAKKMSEQGVAEMNVGKRKPQPDTYHIVNKDGTPTSLMCYLDKDNAIKDRDAKHKGAEVHQVGPRGKVKGVAEGLISQADEFRVELDDDGQVHLLDGENTIRVSMPLDIWKKMAGKKGRTDEFSVEVDNGQVHLLDGEGTIRVSMPVNVWKQLGKQGVAEGSSDISGLMAASHLNKSFIITAETAEGQTKRFRVNAQSERVAKEKFEKHHSMAKIVSIKEEGMAENIEGHQDELEKNLRYSGSRSSVADVIRQKLNPNSAPELFGLKVGDVVKARVDDQIVQGNVIDLFPETMEVELLLRGDMAGRTITVDVRDTQYMDESGVAEERKETKNEKGEVTSWSDETPWHKAKPKKQPSGTAANLAGQALQQTKKMAHKEEPNMTESKATTDNKVFTDTLAMLKKYSGI